MNFIKDLINIYFVGNLFYKQYYKSLSVFNPSFSDYRIVILLTVLLDFLIEQECLRYVSIL